MTSGEYSALQPSSPWATASEQGNSSKGNSSPLLIVGPLGSLPLECAKEIHHGSGGVNFERVTCTPDSAMLRVQVFGPPVEVDSEFPPLHPDPPNSAVNRAAGGTLFLDYIDRCNPADRDWIATLISGQPVRVNGCVAELESNTRVIAAVTVVWIDEIEYAVPQWVLSLFGERTVILESLGSEHGDISKAVDWFSLQSARERHIDNLAWTDEARELLVNRQWPGGLGELRDVVRSLIVATEGELINLDTCKRVLASYESPGMKAVDNHRRQECYNYANGMLYMGRLIRASEVYHWIEQFSRAVDDRDSDPWLLGMRIVREISNNYYYSTDRLRVLVRKAYSSLCAELASLGYIDDLPSVDFEDYPPELKALLVNPLGPFKSAASILPHVSHLIGTSHQQEVARIDNLAEFLVDNENIQAILFCDDFAGTGEQILGHIIDSLSGDGTLQDICERRSLQGKPIILGVIVAVAFTDALEKIRMSGPKWLPVFAHAGDRLSESDRAFSSDSSIFPEPELKAWAKNVIVDQIGSELSPHWPGGFRDRQALVVTADNTPNDTLPVVWRSGRVRGIEWKALFERAASPTG